MLKNPKDFNATNSGIISLLIGMFKGNQFWVIEPSARTTQKPIFKMSKDPNNFFGCT